MKNLFNAIFAISILPIIATAQVNTGSDGSDGEFHPTQDVTVNMADHPNGIYQYTSVNIPQGVMVTFTPNANNTPVTWLVQTDCMINGAVNAAAPLADDSNEGRGGPGGYRGGNGGGFATAGEGPGGGGAGTGPGAGDCHCAGGPGSFGSRGFTPYCDSNSPGQTYGNIFLIPLVGGSGGGGSCNGVRGGGGGGALLIAASGTISINNSLSCGGAYSPCCFDNGSLGSGSGGAIRLVASKITGGGSIEALGRDRLTSGGQGRIRFDAYQNTFGGQIYGVFSQGFQPIIIPAPGQGVQLHIQSVAGVSAPANPGGVLANPDVIVPAQTNNPVPIVVECTNVPLNSEVKVTVHPANGSDVTAVGLNNVGTQSSSTATVSLNLPRGGGILYASTVTGINGGEAPHSAARNSKAKTSSPSYAETGLTAYGERFAKVETKAYLGGKQETTFITKSGKRYSLPTKIR